jgi:ubiquinone/menaquinone biosynthesis C-methylase UbiE|tara:strand:- start:499 stop:837 length:339 start_codon:yes stop_codon:yes gene_type:complete
MTEEAKQAKTKAAETYNAAADHFDDPPLAFWERIGRRTVERVNLQQSSSVLDVACGTGASALPAATMVGPMGSVIGVDLPDHMLVLGRAKAKERGLANIIFRHWGHDGVGVP